MARFNAAVMSAAQDSRFQNRYNYLLDLLDSGYVVEKRIDGSLIRISIDPQGGIVITQDGNQIAGLVEIGGEYGLLSQFLTSSPAADYYAKIGDVTVGASDYSGLIGYLKSYSKTTPVLYITTKYDSGTSELESQINLAGTRFESQSVGGSEYFEIMPLSYSYPMFQAYQDGLNASISMFGSNNCWFKMLYGTLSGSSADVKADMFQLIDGTSTFLEAKRTSFKYLGNTVWHSGNDGAGSTLDADLLDGISSGGSGSNGAKWGYIPQVKNDGVIEIGRYIDFHHTSNDGVDYAVRLATNGSTNDQLFITNKKIWHQGDVDFAVGSGTSSATSGADTNVSFGKTFSSAPMVCANSINGSFTCRIKSVSTTGFVLVISGSSVTFNYIAVSV